jgi:hypothetical protein
VGCAGQQVMPEELDEMRNSGDRAIIDRMTQASYP